MSKAFFDGQKGGGAKVIQGSISVSAGGTATVNLGGVPRLLMVSNTSELRMQSGVDMFGNVSLVPRAGAQIFFSLGGYTNSYATITVTGFTVKKRGLQRRRNRLLFRAHVTRKAVSRLG